jgi:uncharacterized Zn-binding protein involved in type VI secretion
MPFAARITDAILTGHVAPCTVSSTILSTLQTKVYVESKLAAVTGSLITAHTQPNPGAPPPCIPHADAVTGTGSAKVFIGGISANRLGDVADLGTITGSATKVKIG